MKPTRPNIEAFTHPAAWVPTFFMCVVAIVVAAVALLFSGCAFANVSAGLSYSNGEESASVLFDGKTVRVRGGIDQDGRTVGGEVDFRLPRKRAGFAK